MEEQSKHPLRILLKLSGEQLSGDQPFGIDPNFLIRLSEEIKDVINQTNCQIAIVVGGGNIFRGAQLSNKHSGIQRVTADYMGMLATIQNGMALKDSLESCGQEARLQLKIPIPQIGEPFARLKAIGHLEKGRVVIVSGGIGSPLFTTDTAAVSIARELNCTVVLKATKVDGIYTADPSKDPTAQKYAELTHAEALTNEKIAVMDNAALSLAKEDSLPIRVFDMLTANNILRIVQGEQIGTLVH